MIKIVIILRRREKVGIITRRYCTLILTFNTHNFFRERLFYVAMDLFKLPGSFDKISNQDLQQIVNDREMFWNRFFLKIEESYDSSDDTEAIEEIDEPLRVQEREQRLERFCELPSSKTFRRWCRDHGDYLDELTTIAGPPAEDEEDIGEENLDEEKEGEVENEEGDIEEEDIEETWSQTEDEGMGEEKLSCTQCGQPTIYDPDITEDEERFACDLCLLGIHPQCEADCDLCRNIAEKVEQRWSLAGVDPLSALQALQRQ